MNYPIECTKYIKALEANLTLIGATIKNIGHTLNKAHTELVASSYQCLEEFLQDRGLSKGDIKAAKAVADGDLDDRLVWMGVSSSLILKLNLFDAKALIDGKEIDVLTNDGTLALTWGAMTKPQRRQIIGLKDGEACILPPGEQVLVDKKKAPPKPLVFTSIEYHVNKKLLQLETEGRAYVSTITATELYHALRKQGTTEAFFREFADLNNKIGPMTK